MWIAFLIAFMGLFGVGIGVAASVLPSELLKKRDEYERVGRMWYLVSDELAVIKSMCSGGIKDINSYLQETQKHRSAAIMQMYVMQPLPNNRWQIVSSNGDLITHATEKVLLDVTSFYSLVGVQNSLIGAFILYSHTSRASEDFTHQVATFLNIILGNYSKLQGKTDMVVNTVSEQYRISSEQTEKYQKVITWIARTSVVLAVVVLLGCIVFFAGAVVTSLMPPASPMPTPTGIPR